MHSVTGASPSEGFSLSLGSSLNTAAFCLLGLYLASLLNAPCPKAVPFSVPVAFSRRVSVKERQLCGFLVTDIPPLPHWPEFHLHYCAEQECGDACSSLSPVSWRKAICSGPFPVGWAPLCTDAVILDLEGFMLFGPWKLELESTSPSGVPPLFDISDQELCPCISSCSRCKACG